MRDVIRIVLFAAIGLSLASCAGLQQLVGKVQSGTVTNADIAAVVAEARADIQQACGVLPVAADIAAMVTAQIAIPAIVNQVCAAVQASGKLMAPRKLGATRAAPLAAVTTSSGYPVRFQIRRARR